MRRVHNDNGVAVPAVTASSPPTSSSSSKGRKKKKDGESSSKHKSSSKSSREKLTSANSDADQWQKHLTGLQKLTKDFARLDDPLVLQQYEQARAYLTSMSRISQDIMAGNKASDEFRYY
jgi:hypothetical protein